MPRENKKLISMLIEPKPLNNGVKKHDRNIYLRRTFFLALLSFSLSRATRILKMQIINSGLQKGREGQGLLFRGKCLVCKERADSPPSCLKSSKIPGRCCTRASLAFPPLHTDCSFWLPAMYFFLRLGGRKHGIKNLHGMLFTQFGRFVIWEALRFASVNR